MKHSTGNLTIAQEKRFAAMYELGCVACRMNGFKHKTCAEIHHFLSGNTRIGHDATVPLCTWHHKGESTEGASNAALLAYIGPSWHRHRRAFRKRYGSDTELLETVNQLIGDNA